MLEEQLLDAQRHDRNTFKSGVAELDTYLQRYAAQQGKKGVAVAATVINCTDASVETARCVRIAAKSLREKCTA